MPKKRRSGGGSFGTPKPTTIADILKRGTGNRTYASGTTFAAGSAPVRGYYSGTTTPSRARRSGGGSFGYGGVSMDTIRNVLSRANRPMTPGGPAITALHGPPVPPGFLDRNTGGGGGGRQLYGGPSSAAGEITGGTSAPAPAPATPTAPPGLSTAEKDAQLRKEVEALLGLEFDPRQREAERMLEMLGITRKQTGDYFGQYQGQGTRAINEVYDLITGQERGLQTDLDKFLSEQAALTSTGALGSATAAGLGETPLGEEFAREIARSAMTEAQANAAMRGAQYSAFTRAMQDTGKQRAQDVSEFQAQTGADLAEQLQALLEAELGGRRELGDITKERGQAAVALTRDLERDIYERGRQAELDRLQAEQIRRQLGLSEQEFAWQREQDIWGRGLAERELALSERLGAAEIDKAKAELAAAKGDDAKIPSLNTLLSTSGYNNDVQRTIRYALNSAYGNPELILKRYIDNMEAHRKRGNATPQEITEGLEFLQMFMGG
jgi:hypothetical protein